MEHRHFTEGGELLRCFGVAAFYLENQEAVAGWTQILNQELLFSRAQLNSLSNCWQMSSLKGSLLALCSKIRIHYSLVCLTARFAGSILVVWVILCKCPQVLYSLSLLPGLWPRSFIVVLWPFSSSLILQVCTLQSRKLCHGKTRNVCFEWVWVRFK